MKDIDQTLFSQTISLVQRSGTIVSDVELETLFKNTLNSAQDFPTAYADLREQYRKADTGSMEEKRCKNAIGMLALYETLISNKANNITEDPLFTRDVIENAFERATDYRDKAKKSNQLTEQRTKELDNAKKQYGVSDDTFNRVSSLYNQPGQYELRSGIFRTLKESNITPADMAKAAANTIATEIASNPNFQDVVSPEDIQRLVKAQLDKDLYTLRCKITETGNKPQVHATGYGGPYGAGSTYTDRFSPNEYVNGAINLITIQTEEAVAQLVADRTLAKQKDIMKTTTWTKDGESTNNPISTIAIATREFFGDRNPDGSVVLILDATGTLQDYANPAPYSRTTGRCIQNANQYPGGIEEVRDKINEVLTKEVKIKFLTDPASRPEIFADLAKREEAASKEAGVNPTQIYKDIAAILKRSVEIEEARAAGNNSLPSIDGQTYVNSYAERAMNEARAHAGLPPRKIETTPNPAPSPEVIADIGIIKQRTSFGVNPDRDAVILMQTALRDAGFPCNDEKNGKKFGENQDGVDGKYGEATRIAYAAWLKKTQNIEADGKQIDKELMAKLTKPKSENKDAQVSTSQNFLAWNTNQPWNNWLTPNVAAKEEKQLGPVLPKKEAIAAVVPGLSDWQNQPWNSWMKPVEKKEEKLVGPVLPNHSAVPSLATNPFANPFALGPVTAKAETPKQEQKPVGLLPVQNVPDATSFSSQNFGLAFVNLPKTR